MSQTTILFTQPVRHDAEAISLEQIVQRRIQRRRRVAKRMAKRWPLFAVEEMQPEFPGYTYDQWEGDVLRKTRKGKPLRRPKPKGFDWPMIARELPELLPKMRNRTKTRFQLRTQLTDKTGRVVRLVVEVRSVYMSDYHNQVLFHTTDLIRLLRGSAKAFLSHAAVTCWEEKNDLEP